MIWLQALLLLFVPSCVTAARYIVYFSGSHNVIPEPARVSHITHVALAFLGSSLFNQDPPSKWPLFTTVDDVRRKFSPGTKVMVAIGGWGDTQGYSQAAATNESRRFFASNVARMVSDLGADGVDVDWEYPAGNGEDYKLVPNSAKAWEKAAYPLLLAELRGALGSSKLISAAVPGLRRDMLAFTPEVVAAVLPSLDFWNVMTYDMFNRRDNVTKHHAGVELSLDAVAAYHERGVPFADMNLGFAFYIKWYKTDPASRAACVQSPVGCKTSLMEDPVTGVDLGRAGAFSWHDFALGAFPKELRASYEKALAHGRYDEIQGGHYYFDAEEDIWWSWETPYAIKRKYEMVAEQKGIGGMFPWGLGEDAPDFEHLDALNSCVEESSRLRDAFLSDDL